MSRIQREQLDAQLRSAGDGSSGGGGGSANGAGGDGVGGSTGAAVQPTVEDLRAGFVQLMSTLPVPGGVRVDARPLGGRPALHISPESREAATGTLLYFHGGSHVVGSPHTALGLTAELVLRTGIPAYSLDYRLAPEHPFPADVEDVVAAYRELLDAAHPPQSIAFAGDSAGGGLSVTGALAARDAGLPMPAALVAFSPGLDATREGRSMVTKAAADPLLDRADIDRMSHYYVADADGRDPLLSPAVSGDLAGLPPMLLQVGTNELLLDDARRLALRASDAEVDVVLDITAKVPHVFQAFTDSLDEAGEALDRAALFLRQRIRG
ncbi:alpha/beta hydrolase [Phaeacidiphilus oryzae]|uniref:alpha/beta hydrolase n=1 Tax=Phaeacidiphilus oryzae TaxID=348818 RepID=UPI000A03141E|nr:alpha/beta hydrolase [Phaeacidiphilus oryzae]